MQAVPRSVGVVGGEELQIFWSNIRLEGIPSLVSSDRLKIMSKYAGW